MDDAETLLIELLLAVDDLWANIDMPEIDQLEPETYATCQAIHQYFGHGEPLAGAPHTPPHR